MEEKNKRMKFLFFGLSIESQSKENPQRLEQLEAFHSILSNFSTFKFYASIVHDKDKRDDGSLRLAHLHLFVELYEKMTPLQLLKLVSEVLGVDKSLISVEGSHNNFLLVQYLTHKNHPAKHQYDINEVKTNNKETLEARFCSRYEDPKEREIALILTAKTFAELLALGGLDFAKRYQSVFNQVKKEEKQDFEGLLNDYNTLKATFERLLEDLKILFHKIDFRINESQLRAELQIDQWTTEIERLKELI